MLGRVKEATVAPNSKGPTRLDRLVQLAYKGAYRLMRVYWAVRRPTTHGALVAVWHEGEILLVKNSYLHYFSLPGGYLRSGETGRMAAIRELREEVGLVATEEDLELALDETHDWDGKRDHVEIYWLAVTHRPVVKIDHREVVAAGWFTPERALQLELFPKLRAVIETRRTDRT